MASERTKQCRRLKNLFSVLHFLFLFGPLLFFVPYGFVTGQPVEKIGLSFTVVISIILLVMSVIVSVTARAGLHRSVMWMLIIGVLFCLKNIQTFIWIMAVCSVIDELVFVRLKDHYKAALISNKEIDRRE